jgi:polyribonucleotide nucleotidyltransferase
MLLAWSPRRLLRTFQNLIVPQGGRVVIIECMIRIDGRTPAQLRPINFEIGFSNYAEGSVLWVFASLRKLFLKVYELED